VGRKALAAEYREALTSSLDSFSQPTQGYSGQVTLDVAPGHGEALGRRLRHALLSIVPGFAVTHVKLSYEEEGREKIVPHAYTRIPGVVEDVRQIMAHLGRIT
jgi:DNA-directed RNA polymerase alpha subunit